MKLLSREEVRSNAVERLRLNPQTFDLTSREVVANTLRRAAALLCPCSSGRLIEAAVRPAEDLVEDRDRLKGLVRDTLETLLAYGDLLEFSGPIQPDRDGGSTLVYTAAPRFVRRCSGMVLLLGIIPDVISPLPEDLQQKIDFVGHVRRLQIDDVEDLIQYGLTELSYDDWLKMPKAETAEDFVGRLDGLLNTAGPSGDIEDLTLLDYERPVHYYSGRWVKPGTRSGRFVARRPQAYGNPLWCYVYMKHGSPKKFVDFPIEKNRHRGCDDAWRLQAAIDAVRGQPQRFRARDGTDGTKVIDFFSPVPMWATRRWDSIGKVVPATGCLFSYEFTEEEIGEELKFMGDRFWLREK